MKLFFLALSLLATNAFANDTEMPCENVAHEVAAFINKSGWGEVEGYVPVTTKKDKDKDGFLIFNVSIKRGNDTLGDSYEIVMRKSPQSEACITLSVNK